MKKCIFMVVILGSVLVLVLICSIRNFIFVIYNIMIVSLKVLRICYLITLEI